MFTFATSKDSDQDSILTPRCPGCGNHLTLCGEGGVSSDGSSPLFLKIPLDLGIQPVPIPVRRHTVIQVVLQGQEPENPDADPDMKQPVAQVRILPSPASVEDLIETVHSQKVLSEHGQITASEGSFKPFGPGEKRSDPGKMKGVLPVPEAPRPGSRGQKGPFQ